MAVFDAYEVYEVEPDSVTEKLPRECRSLLQFGRFLGALSLIARVGCDYELRGTNPISGFAGRGLR